MSKISENEIVWTSNLFDRDTQDKVKYLKKNDLEEFEDSFYKDLEFGTGGMRGVMGVGPNRVNKYTFGRNTQAISNILNTLSKDSSVVIGHDCRNNSRELSLIVADIFSANNIKTYIFDSLKPTPLISYAVRKLNCKCGIVLTASHNPPEYNGYKVYWSDGGQIVPPIDENIITEISKTDYSEINFNSNPQLIELVDNKIEDSFVNDSIDTAKIGDSNRKNLKIVFTALHGTSHIIIPEILNKAGYSKLFCVDSQMNPDGNFSNVNSSNPEDPDSLNEAINLAKVHDADLVIGTDPDADRFGIAVKNLSGDYELINGNQSMCVMTDYILTKSKIDKNSFIASTVVSTPMMSKIASINNIKIELSLTGFKWIGKMINDFKDLKFLGGGEESFGYLIGDFVRDKDALTSSLLISEICSEFKAKGSSFYERMIDCYIKYGFFKEKLYTLKKEGKKGALEITNIISNLKLNPPDKLLDDEVLFIEDYESSIKMNLETDEKSTINLPKTNMIIFESKKGFKVAVRPSGTEPKIKYYFSVNCSLNNKSEFLQKNKLLDEKLNQLLIDFTN